MKQDTIEIKQAIMQVHNNNNKYYAIQKGKIAP